MVPQITTVVALETLTKIVLGTMVQFHPFLFAVADIHAQHSLSTSSIARKFAQNVLNHQLLPSAAAEFRSQGIVMLQGRGVPSPTGSEPPSTIRICWYPYLSRDQHPGGHQMHPYQQ